MASSNQGSSKQGSSKQGSQSNQSGKGGSQGSNRGFASMDPDRQREIASEGGKAAHARGSAHEFDSEEGREAGRKSHSGQSQSSRGQSSTSGGGSRADSSPSRGSSGRQGSR